MSLLGFIMDHRVTYRGEVALLTRVWVLLSISGHPWKAFHQQGSGFLAGIKAGHLRQVVASSWVLGWGAHNRPSTKECVVVWIKMVYTSQAVGGRFLSLRPVWSTEWVPGQPRLRKKSLSLSLSLSNTYTHTHTKLFQTGFSNEERARTW